LLDKRVRDIDHCDIPSFLGINDTQQKNGLCCNSR
jgi:hypothetical protein